MAFRVPLAIMSSTILEDRGSSQESQNDNQSAATPDEQPEPGQLEVDSADGDSAYGESTKSSYLTSIASEVTRGTYENGRRYHSYGSAEYAFPNDDNEVERLDLQHHMMTALMQNRLWWAPINHNPLRVLDIGTGTGVWAMDFADIFPSAEVIGTDLSPIQKSWVPPNCRFEIDDAEREWTFGVDSFDFIHARNLICAIRDWPRLVHQCYEHTRPGGWVEFQMKHVDIKSDDGTLPPDSALRRWGELTFEASAKMGTDFVETTKVHEYMQQSGFVNVQQHICKLPIGPWAKNRQLKKVGALELVNFVDGIEGLSLRMFCKVLGMSIEAVQVLLMEIRQEAKNSKVHSYYPFYVIYGQKPGK